MTPLSATALGLVVVILLLALLVRYRATMPSSKLCPSPVVRTSKIPVKTQTSKSPVPVRPAEPANRHPELVKRSKKPTEKGTKSDFIILRINEPVEKPYAKGSKEKLCRNNSLNRECNQSSLAKAKVTQSSRVLCSEVPVSKQLNGCSVVSGGGSAREVMGWTECRTVTRLMLLRRKCTAGKVQRCDTVPTVVLDKPKCAPCDSVGPKCAPGDSVALTSVSVFIDSFCVHTGRQVAERRFRTECQVGASAHYS